MIVLAQKSDCIIIGSAGVVEPCHRIDTVVGEILIGALAQQTQEGELNGTDFVVGDFETCSQRTKPSLVSLLLPVDDGLLSTDESETRERKGKRKRNEERSENN